MFETTIEIYINKTDDNIALKRLFKTTVCLPQLFKIAKFVIKTNKSILQIYKNFYPIKYLPKIFKVSIKV